MHHQPAHRREPDASLEHVHVDRFTPTPGDVDVVSVTEAAAMLGLSRQRVHQYVQDGRLVTAKRDGQRWTIAGAEIEWLLT